MITHHEVSHSLCHVEPKLSCAIANSYTDKITRNGFSSKQQHSGDCHSDTYERYGGDERRQTAQMFSPSFSAVEIGRCVPFGRAKRPTHHSLRKS